MSPEDQSVNLMPSGPPDVERPSPEIFRAMGQDGVFRMIADFYAELAQSEIAWMFPADMRAASEKSAAFFVGLLGGPPLYHQRYGSPMLRARHMPFPIDEDARRVWLDCFRRVLDGASVRYNFPTEHMAGFWEFLDRFSAWMVNTTRG